MPSVVDQFRTRKDPERPPGQGPLLLWLQGGVMFVAAFAAIIWVMQGAPLPDVEIGLAFDPTRPSETTASAERLDRGDRLGWPTPEQASPHTAPVRSPWQSAGFDQDGAKPEPSDEENAERFQEQVMTGVWLAIGLIGGFTLIVTFLRGSSPDSAARLGMDPSRPMGPSSRTTSSAEASGEPIASCCAPIDQDEVARNKESRLGRRLRLMQRDGRRR